MRQKKLLALLLSVVLAAIALTACAQQQTGGGTEEEMERDFEMIGEVIRVESNDEDAYTVTITEDNLKEDREYAENNAEVVTPEEAGVSEEAPAADEDEMSRSEDELDTDEDIELEPAAEEEPLLEELSEEEPILEDQEDESWYQEEDLYEDADGGVDEDMDFVADYVEDEGADLMLIAETDTVVVTAYVPADAVPEGTSLQVRDAELEATDEALADIDLEEPAYIRSVKALEVLLLDADGTVIEPASPIRLEIIPLIVDEDVFDLQDQALIVRLPQDLPAEVVEREFILTEDGDTQTSTYSFETDSPSLFAIAYIDYHADDEATELDEPVQEPTAWSLESVKQEDVIVSYNIPDDSTAPDDSAASEGEELQWVTLQAEVTGFSNDNGVIELSFRRQPDDETDTCMYTVHFAGTECYVVVQAVPAPSDVVVDKIDYGDELTELEGYQPSFSDEDISLPEGTFIEDGELVVTDAASETAQEALVESGFAEGEMSRAGSDNDADSNSGSAGSSSSQGSGSNGSGSNGSGSNASGSGSGSNGSGSGASNNNPPQNNNVVEEEHDLNSVHSGDIESDAASEGSAGDWGDSATVEYLKEYNERARRFNNYDAVANYAPEVLGYIHPTAGKVGEFGANAYRIFKAYYRNDWGSGIQGTLGVLRMFGLFKVPRGVSNEQIMSEVQKVGLEVSDLHCLTKAMNATLDQTLQQAYANNLQTFDNAVISMHANAEIVQNMLVEGAIRAAEDGLEPPEENCDAEDEFEYNYNLVQYIKELEKKGGRKNSAFAGFTDCMKGLTSDFVLVSGEVAKQGEFNPIKSYDKFWDLHFNLEPQGYYLRQSYRSDIEYELKRAFALMEIYYNIFDPYDKGNHLEYNNELFAALQRLEDLDAGVSPEDVRAHTKQWVGCEDIVMYCPTFGHYIKAVKAVPGNGEKIGATVPTGNIEKYIQKLHGGSLLKDLKLAGLYYNGLYGYNDGVYIYYPDYTHCGDHWYAGCAHGLGFNGRKSGDWYAADIIGWDSKLHKDIKVTHKNHNKKIDPFDDKDVDWSTGIPYLTFEFI